MHKSVHRCPGCPHGGFPPFRRPGVRARSGMGLARDTAARTPAADYAVRAARAREMLMRALGRSRDTDG